MFYLTTHASSGDTRVDLLSKYTAGCDMGKGRPNRDIYHSMTSKKPRCQIVLVMKVDTERDMRLIAAAGATRLILSLEPGRWPKRNYKHRAHL